MTPTPLPARFLTALCCLAPDGTFRIDGVEQMRRRPIRGLVEARGVGLLRADPLDEVPLALVADLGRLEDQRLPPNRVDT